MIKPRKNCIFTSAGKYNNVINWLKGERSWDLVTAFYGTSAIEQDRIKKVSDVFFLGKGSKFQLLHFLNRTQPEIFEKYEYIWVMDDDLVITPEDIEKAFEEMKKWDLWVAQPSFDPHGKVSHAITKVNPDTYLRFVDFVEVTCPIFLSSKLFEFLDHYDGGLVGWGIDYWIAHTLKSKEFHKFAIFDFIQILNPHDNVKNGQREIDSLQSSKDRQNHSKAVLGGLGITEWVPENLYFVFEKGEGEDTQCVRRKLSSNVILKNLKKYFK